MCENELVGVKMAHLEEDLSQKWLKRFEGQMMNENDLRSHWASKVPQFFAPKLNCNCLNIVYDDQAALNELFIPMERFITNSFEPLSIFNQLKQMDDPPALCGRVFKSGEPTYSCRDCGLDPTCVLCVECFQNSAHKNHRYKMSMSGGGGYCDCGDREAWRSEPFCSEHLRGVTQTGSSSPKRLSAEFECMIERTRIIMCTVLRYCFEILTWEHCVDLPTDLQLKTTEDPESQEAYATMLFNDEIHTYEQVINTLSRAIDCNQKEAIEYATTIDREGRSVVKCAQFTSCHQVKTVIERITSRHGSKPLRVDVMRTSIIAHQTFAMKLLAWLQGILAHCEMFRAVFSEILMKSSFTKNEKSNGEPSLLELIMDSDTHLWKTARNQWHQLFISGLLMEQSSKKEFAKIFTKVYGRLMKDFIVDDHEHSVSITSLSVQLFTVPTLAQALIAEENAIVILLKSFLSECGRHRNHDGKLSFERNHTAITSFRRAQYILYDLKYLLSVKPTEWTESLRKNFLHGLSTLVELLVWMQGMDAVVRQVGQHVEFEAEWETGVNLQLKLAPIVALCIEWCSSDRVTLIKALRLTLKELDEIGGKFSLIEWELCGYHANCIDYDVSTMPVTIHLPLSRFVAGLLLQLGKYELNYNDPNFIMRKKPLPIELMELPLRTQVMIAQFRAGMWRRNGYSLVNQVYFYHNVKLREEMYDRDILMLQIGAARIDPNEYVIHVLNKFGLLFWAQENYEGVNRKPEEDYVRQTISLVEEFLGLILIIMSERFLPGVGKISQEDRIKKEVIQWLAMEPMTHSELVKYLPKETNVYECEIENVISSVSVFKKIASSSGKYELKAEYFERFNPFFYHYTRQDQSCAEEVQLKRKKHNNEEFICCPPPIPPDLAPNFSAMIYILNCDIMLHVMSIVLKRTCNLHAVSYSETQFEKVLHLIGLALHEEAKSIYENFNFTEALISKSIYGTLEECLQCPRIDSHKDLLRWIIKKFKEVRQLRNQEIKNDDLPVASTSEEKDLAKSERKKNSELAAARRARIMAQMSAMQKNFIKEHAEFFKQSDTGVSGSDSLMDLTESFVSSDPVALGINQNGKLILNEKHTCILCREEQEIGSSKRCMVLSGFVQRSTVLSKNRERKLWNDVESMDSLFVPSDLYFGPHISTCGHVMHSDCWQKFFETVLVKERRRPIRYGRHISFDVDKNEFLCPLCECLSNAVIPIIPPINVKKCNVDISISGWLLSLHTALEKVQPIWVKDATMTGETGEKYNCRFQPRPLSIVLSSLSVELAEKFQTIINEYSESSLELQNLSGSIHEMMKLLSQAIYTVGLGVHPNNDDDRVPFMSYWACTYTIQSIERMLRDDKKPIFGDLSSRKYNCLQALVRYVAYSNSVFDDAVIKSHCVRILRYLLMNEYYVSSPFCLLDLDAFGILVTLTISSPLLYTSEREKIEEKANLHISNGSSVDKNYVHFVLVFQLVQVILTNDWDIQEEPMETDTKFEHKDAETDLLAQFCWDVLIAAGAPEPNRIKKTNNVMPNIKEKLLPFLRSTALFHHFLTNVQPPQKLKETNLDLSSSEEFDVLCFYLGIPFNFGNILETDMQHLALNWARHPRVQLIINTKTEHSVQSPSEIPCKLVVQPHAVNQLMSLPVDYSELINSVSQFTCPNSEGDDSRSPTMCLVCGVILCSQSYCCQTELDGMMVGACTFHAYFCGAGVGIFLRIRDCKILLLAGRTKGCYMAPPYIDEYGETDQGLLRGNPLHLCELSYKELHRLWLRHGIPEQIAHALELSSNLAATNWQLL